MRRLLLVTLLASCGSLRRDASLSIAFDSTDLPSLSAEMMEDLVRAPRLGYLERPDPGGDDRIAVFLGGIVNGTREEFDSQDIAARMRTTLLQAGKFRFVGAGTPAGEARDQVRAQGMRVEAEVVLYGDLRTVDRGSREAEGDYQFVLVCEDLRTAEVLWQGTIGLRRTPRSGVFRRV